MIIDLIILIFPNQDNKPYRSYKGKMIWNTELKKQIPYGWTNKKLSQILLKNAEKFCYTYIKPVIDLSVMLSNSITISKNNWSNNFSTNLYKMRKGDILFGSIRPYLHKAGFAPYDGVVAGTVHSFKPLNKEDYNFALITMTRNTFFDYAVNMSVGTKMPVVSSDSILNFTVPYNKTIVRKFNNISFVEVISENIKQNQQLVSLRDYLLPLLMNSQVTVS
ncbi:hypothetical protein [Mycoplasma capricolum]|uniref:hypothetical protein n=1 Tax=Mycoplasma capricolum TaxID=2095 RepID=UPI0022F3AD78|nr:hypothetical protein [Mycoplasma capricolum]WBX36241.1 hypothetical protein NO343_04805 [Mycoplasma capricolum subsp. capricolum]